MRLITILIVLVFLGSCKDKVICPAFQSTYILDDSVRAVYYSYLWKLDEETRLKYLADQRPKSTDSTGAVVASVAEGVDYFAYVEPYIVEPREVRKTKYGMVKYEPYWLKNYRHRTAPMENVLAPDPIEKDTVVDVGEFVASDFSDSTAVGTDGTASVASADSTAEEVFELPTIARAEPPKPKTQVKFLYGYDPEDKMLNVEQEYYNKHFGKYLYVNEPIVYDSATSAPDSAAAENSGWLKRFFQRLFSGDQSKKTLVAEEESSTDTDEWPADGKKEEDEEPEEDTGF